MRVTQHAGPPRGLRPRERGISDSLSSRETKCYSEFLLKDSPWQKECFFVPTYTAVCPTPHCYTYPSPYVPRRRPPPKLAQHLPNLSDQNRWLEETPMIPRLAGVGRAHVAAGKSATSQSGQEQGRGGWACTAPPWDCVILTTIQGEHTHQKQSKCETILHVYRAGISVMRLQ